ncbi:MAG: universal stress protein [Actinomycetota bacterium]
MFKTILFPTDFSEYSLKTLEYVWGLKAAGVERVILVNILEAVDEYPIALARKRRTLEALKEQEEILSNHGLQTESRVELGKPYREILRIAEEEEVSMIVIGCHGKGLLDEVVIGSVSDRVTREATVPVMLVKYKVLHKEGGDRLEKTSGESFKKILYTTDGSPCAQMAKKFIRGFAQAGCKEVIIASVVDPNTVPQKDIPKAVKELETKLSVAAGELRERGLMSKVMVPVGTPLEELLRIAKEERVSLIVMGSTGKGYFKQMVLGSVSESMIREAKCPVLIIHNEVCEIPL